MCNLYHLRGHLTPKDFASLFGVQEVAPDLFSTVQHWPMKPGLIVRNVENGSEREAAVLRWGLVPHWADDPKIGRTMTNARGETVASKPSFRNAFRSRRCLIPASGFCEYWEKKWYEFTLLGQTVFAMAGLWERWNKGDEPLETFTMLTTQSNDLVTQYHAKQRMPVILDADNYDRWLIGTTEDAQDLLRAYPADRMAVAPVS